MGSAPYALAANVFASLDDPVLQQEGESPGEGSPLLPVLDASGNMVFDWTYTWMFTGRRSDATNRTVYDGDVVVFHNRPFGVDSIVSPLTGNTYSVPAGEQVVEAVFAYGTAVSTTDGRRSRV